MEFETWNRDTLIKETKAAMAGAKFHSDNFLDLLIKQKYYSDDDLHQKTDYELQDIYIQLKEQDEIFCREYEESQEKGRFFNQPSCNADFSYWSKQAYWSINEAILLMLGKDPRNVFWDDVKMYIATSPFVKKFNELRELARRYLNCKELYDPVFPGIFLAWAERMSISIPTELKETVNTLGVQVDGWKNHYEQLSERYNQLNKQYSEGIVFIKTKVDKRTLNRLIDTPMAGARDIESAAQRCKRLKKRKNQLREKGIKHFLQVISKEENISVSRVKQILQKKEKKKNIDILNSAWT